jgi:ankyrin repeat protein
MMALAGKTKNGNTLLHFAVHAQYHSAQKEILEKVLNLCGGFDVHNDAGMTQLHLAITTGSLEAASVLLSFRRNHKGTNENGDLVLHEAINTRPSAESREVLIIPRYTGIWTVKGRDDSGHVTSQGSLICTRPNGD